jgi:hypothetical protein
MQIRAYDLYSPANLSAAGVTVNGVSVSPLAYLGPSGASSLYSVTYTVSEGNTDIAESASVPISVVIADRAGNTNTAYTASPTFDLCPAIDAHRPTISSTVSFNPGEGEWVKAGESIYVTITASDTTTGTLTKNQVTVNSEATTGFAQSGDDYTVTYAVSAGDTQRSQSQSIPVYVDVADDAGNQATRSITPAANQCPGIDTLRPSVGLSFGGSEPTNDNPFTVSIAFSEAVNSSTFTLADITVSTGTKSNLNTSDNRNWTVDITPPSSTYDGSIDVSVASNQVQDPAGNTNTASNTLTVDYDGERPDVSVSLVGGGTQNSPFEVRITFTEAINPSTFSAGDISVSPGSAGTPTSSDDRVWTATITPTPSDYVGDVNVSVSSGRAQDPAGNNNTASNTLTVSYDGS